MRYEQRDIVWLNFLFSNGTFKPHLGIIVSNNTLHQTTGEMYVVLISSKKYYPEYCLPITDDMVTGFSFDKTSYVICHIISGYIENSIINKVGRMKIRPFNEMVDSVIGAIL